MSSLSSAQIQQYKNDGYVAPLDVLSKDEALEIREEIELIEKKWPDELKGLGRNYIHLISHIFDKVSHNPKILEDFKHTNLPLYKFLLNKWYIDELYEKLFVNPAKKIGSFFWKKGDIGIIDRFGPDGISKLVKIISNRTGRFQTGFIYDYAFVMLLGLSILLTYLILK